MESLKEKTARGLFWSGLSGGVQKALNLLFGIILARLLTQSDYGMVGLLAIFSEVAGTLQEGGFINALNRRENVSDADYNSVFWFSVLTGLLLYSLLFVSAPLIANFYGIEELTALARYVFLGFLITSFGIASRAYVFRNMMVRESSVISVSALIISSGIGIAMAANGFSYWGIATQSITYNLLSTGANIIVARWRPSLSVDFKPVREMFVFSSRLVITSLVNIAKGNIFPIILGKLFTPCDVGNYTQANKWNFMGWSTIAGMCNSVGQPVFARTADDCARQLRILRKLLRFTAFLAFPAMFGLGLISHEMIVILLTERWAEAADMLRWLCIAGAFLPISTLLVNLLISRGRSDIFMWGSIALSVVMLPSMITAASHGIGAMIVVYNIMHVGEVGLWYWFVRRETGLTVTNLISDLSPYLLLSLALVAATAVIAYPITNIYMRLGVKVVVMSTGYCFALWAFRSKVFIESINYFFKRWK
jgi:O-antigen/teichoic acid export membrane protein